MSERKSWRDYSTYIADNESGEKAGGLSDSSKTFASAKPPSSWQQHSKFNPSAVIVDRVNDWLNKHNSFVTSYQDRYSNPEYGKSYVADSGDWLNTVNSQKSSLYAEADSILDFMEQTEDYLDEEWMAGIKKILWDTRGKQNLISIDADKDDKYWSSFGSEEMVKQFGSAEKAYNQFQKWDAWHKKYSALSYPTLKKAMEALENGEEKDWLAYNITSLAKNSFTMMPDWEKNSEYHSTYRGGEEYNPILGYYTNTGFDDIEYDYINGNDTARKRMLLEDVQLGTAFYGLDKSYLKEMTKDEILVYNYLYAVNGKEEANGYLAILLSDLNYRQRQNDQKYWSDYAAEHPFLSSAFSVMISPMKGLSVMGQVADYMDDGVIDQNAEYNKFSYVSSDIRNQVASDIAKGHGQVGSWLYQLGMSGADFLVNTAVSGGSQGLSLALMGSSAMADTVIDAKNRGLSDDQAMILGVVAGGAEIITEKFSLDALFKGNPSAGKLRYILTNAFTEGTEEVSSSLINLAADVIVSKDKSEWEMAIQEYLEKNPNATEQEAFQKVLGDTVLSLGLDYLGGSLMGGGMGSGGVAVNTVVQNYSAKDTYGGSQQDLVGEALEINPENRFAQRMQGRLDKGKDLTGGQLNRLVQQNEATMNAQDMANIQSATEARLNELGETGDVAAIAAALTKQAAGKKLSIAEKKLISGSKYGGRVANELNTKNIKSGDYSSEWAQKLDTNRINAGEYSRLVEDAQLPTNTADNAPVIATPAAQARNDNAGQPGVNGENMGPVAQLARETPGVVDTEQANARGLARTKRVTQAAQKAGKVATIEDFAAAYGDHSAAMVQVYEMEGSSQGAEQFARGYEVAYNWGYSGVADSYLSRADTKGLTGILTEAQRQKAYDNGVKAAQADNKTPGNPNKLIGKNRENWRKGGVRAVGTTMAEIDKAFKGDVRGAVVNYMRKFAEITGIDVVFYASKEVDGEWVGPVIKDGGLTVDLRNSDGGFCWDNNKIYIDINAGAHNNLSAKEILNNTMLYTFGHEFVHFCEKWNAEEYLQFRQFVFQYMDEKMARDAAAGNTEHRNMEELIRARMEHEGRDYDYCAREVLADALAKILPDSNFAQELAQENMTWVEKILDMLKKFIADIKAALKGIDPVENAPHVDIRENIGGSMQYLEEIRQMYDKLAAGAVENYQAAMEAETQKNTTREGSVSRKARMTDAEIQAVQGIGRISVNQFSSADIKATERFAQQYWKEMGVKSPFFRAWFGDWRANDQTKVQVATQKGDTRGVQKNTDTGWDIQVSGKVFNETGHKAKKNQGALAYLPYINDVVEKAVLLDSFGVGAGKAKSANSLLMHSMYTVADIGNGPVLLKLFVEEMNNPNADGTIKRAYQLQNIEMQQLSAKGSSVSSSPVTSTATIRTVADLFAAVKQKDADFNPNPVSGITNADGTPKALYHGSADMFNTFSYGHIGSASGVSILGEGFYFTDKKKLAKNYGENVYECYLQMKKPYRATEGDAYKLNTQKLESQGYDGVILDTPTGTVYMVFKNTQIKSATNNIGTFDGTNADIRYKRRASAPKTFRNSQNAKGEFVANVLIDLNDPDSEWWTGRYNRGILSMSMSDDTEFRHFYAEIEKRTKDMEAHDEAAQQAVTDAFTVQDGNGKEYVYRVELDGYMHGVVLEKVNKKKFEAALRKETVGGNHGQSDADIKRRAGNARVGMERSRASDGGSITPGGTVGSGRMGSGSPRSNQAGNDSRGQSSNQEVSDSVTETKVSGKKRGTTLSDREVLEVAALRMDTSTLTEGEQTALQIFKDRLAEMRKLQIERERLGSLWHEQQFGSGDRSEAPKTLNRMQVLDGQIERAVNSVLSVEDKQILRDVLQKARQYVKEQSVDHYRGILERRKDRSIQAQLRQKLHSTVHELSQLLLHGDKNHHVPESMKKAVAGALDVINSLDARKTAAQIAALDSRIMELLQQKQAITQQMTDENSEQMSAKLLSLEGEIQQLQKRKDSAGRLQDKLAELQAAYAEIGKGTDPDFEYAYDITVANAIQGAVEKIGDTELKDMSTEQLESLCDAYKMLRAAVRNSNRSFTQGRNATTDALIRSTINEVKKVGGVHESLPTITAGVRKYLWNNLKPVYAMEKIGSDTFTNVFWSLIEGEGVYAGDVADAVRFTEKLQDKYGYEKWDFKKKYSFTSTAGTKFDLTLEQIMSLYAYAKRGDQALEHLRLGGFVFDSSIETYKEKDGKKSILKHRVNVAKAHQLSAEIVGEIVAVLDDMPNVKSFVDEMQAYLSDTMGAKGNEVSMAMYDVALFKEKAYFPLKSAKQYMHEQNEIAGEVRIKNSGFTNKLTPGANNPVILSNFMDVWANHVHDMSMYHSFVLPIEDFNRIFNGKTRQAEGVEAVSVKGTLQEAYGPEAVNYLRQLITDLNGGARSDPRESTGKALMSRFKKAAVMGSASVVIQQPSAMIRARALIDEKYFNHINPKLLSHNKLWEELKKYAPVAVIKEMGRFDMDTGRGTVDYIKNEKTLMDKVDDVLSVAPAKADEWAWIQIWEAVKRETAVKHPDMKTGSEEFLKIAGKRFTEVIVKTQVYDSTLSRSANMRSKSGLMNMVTAFMAEPTTSINMLEQSVRDWKRGNKKAAVRGFTAVYGSVLLNSLLVSIVYAMRDDDEDETFLEKYFSSVTTEMVDGINPLTYLPWIKDAWSILQGFDVERSDMSLINDASEALTNLVKVLSKDTENMSADELAEHNKTVAEGWFGMTELVFNFFGVPVKNVRRDAMGMINAITTLKTDITERGLANWEYLKDQLSEALKNSLPVVGWLPDKSVTDKLYDAIISEDDEYRARIEATFKRDTEAETQTAIKNAVRKALKENDPRITQMAEAYLDGDYDTVMDLYEEIHDEGKFVHDTIRAAYESRIGELEKKYGLVEEPDFTPDGDEADVLFDAEAYYTAVTGGDNSGAEFVKSDMLEHMSETDFNSKFRSTVKSHYEDGDLSGDEAERMLTKHGGHSAQEAGEYVRYWDFQEEYPDLELSKAAVTKYYDGLYKDGKQVCKGAESFGISIEIYAQYCEQKSGYSKKDDILKVIDALPLTKKQKDALYYLNGWAKSNIYDTPWH